MRQRRQRARMREQNEGVAVMLYGMYILNRYVMCIQDISVGCHESPGRRRQDEEYRQTNHTTLMRQVV